METLVYFTKTSLQGNVLVGEGSHNSLKQLLNPNPALHEFGGHIWTTRFKST